ncbi:hypothetical protein AOLI_G00005710 [Acnodon oligacanthus]
MDLASLFKVQKKLIEENELRLHGGYYLLRQVQPFLSGGDERATLLSAHISTILDGERAGLPPEDNFGGGAKGLLGIAQQQAMDVQASLARVPQPAISQVMSEQKLEEEQPTSAFSIASPGAPASEDVAAGPPASEDVATGPPASEDVATGPPASEDIAPASELPDLAIATVSPDLLIPV